MYLLKKKRRDGEVTERCQEIEELNPKYSVANWYKSRVFAIEFLLGIQRGHVSKFTGFTRWPREKKCGFKLFRKQSTGEGREQNKIYLLYSGLGLSRQKALEGARGVIEDRIRLQESAIRSLETACLVKEEYQVELHFPWRQRGYF